MNPIKVVTRLGPPSDRVRLQGDADPPFPSVKTEHRAHQAPTDRAPGHFSQEVKLPESEAEQPPPPLATLLPAVHTPTHRPPHLLLVTHCVVRSFIGQKTDMCRTSTTSRQYDTGPYYQPD
jgi:hypothetical protein